MVHVLEKGKPEGHISRVCPGKGIEICTRTGDWGFTSHVFFALEDDESISSVGLFLLVGSFVSMGISNNADLCMLASSLSECRQVFGETNAFNGTKATKLALKVSFIGIITESRNDKGLESIAANIGILVWFVCNTR